MPDPKPLAVVTGASSGIGYELAMVFARNGHDLLVCAEDARIADCARDFGGAGAQVESLQVNLAAEGGVEKLYDRIRALGRPVDAIAINAGVGVGGSFLETDLEAELNLVRLNVASTVHLAKRVAKDMAARRKGRVLFTSSVASWMPAPFEAVYGASKAFVQSFAQALRNELADHGVSVTALMPGPTETNFFHRAGMDDTKVGTDKKDDAAQVAQEGYDALMAGKDHVIAGSFKNAVQATAAKKVLSEPAASAEHRKLTEPGSGKK